jgi:hypothetical protein
MMYFYTLFLSFQVLDQIPRRSSPGKTPPMPYTVFPGADRLYVVSLRAPLQHASGCPGPSRDVGMENAQYLEISIA